MRRRRARHLLLLAAFFALAPGVSAQGDGAIEGALFLLLPVGARAVSLGRAMAWVEGAEGVFWNPAGLVGVDRRQAVIFRSDNVVGTTYAFSFLRSRPGAGTIGVTYFLMDAGGFQRTDGSGNPIGSTTIRNHVGVLSVATRIFDGLSAGLNFKVIRYQESCRGICPDEGTTATTYAIDAGLQARPSERLRLGAMVAHLGPRLQADPLPARIRVAGAYDILDVLTDADELHGWLAVEVEGRLRQLGSRSVYLGAEVIAGSVDALSLRAGYVRSELVAENGFRVGLGLRYEQFDLSVAKALSISPLTGESEPVHVTMAIAF